MKKVPQLKKKDKKNIDSEGITGALFWDLIANPDPDPLEKAKRLSQSTIL